MTKTRVDAALQKVDSITTRNLQTANREAALVDSAQLLGAIRATQTLGSHISAQSFRALIRFRDEKGHEALGFERFDDFLNNYPDSPMSKNQFYDRLNALEREGDASFDLLNSLKIPIATRKQLCDGQVRIEGETVFVGLHDTEVAVPLNDRAKVTEVLRELATKNAQKRRTIERGKADVIKLKKKLDTAKQSGASGSSPFDHALLNLLGAFTALISEVENLSPDEVEERRATMFVQLTNQRLRLEEAFGLKAPHTNGNGKLHLSDETMDELSDAL